MFSTKERLLLGTLAGAKFTHIMDFMIMMPLAPQLMRIFGIDAQQFGILVSSYTFSAGIIGFLGAFVIDRFDRKKALLFAYVGFVVGTFLCGLANSYGQLMLARIFTGMFGGVLNALVLSIIGDSFQLKKRASAMGVVMAAFSAAAALGVPFGIYVAATWSWNYPFLILGAMSLVVLFGILFVVPPLSQHLDHIKPKTAPWTVVTRIAQNPNQLRALALKMFLVLGQFMIIPFIAPYMVGNIGFSELELTYIYLLGGFLTLFTGPIIGRWADRYGHKRTFMVFASLSILPILMITHLPSWGMLFALLSTSLFFILISGRIIPAITMEISSVHPEYRAGFMSISSALQQMSAGLAALIGGSIVIETASKTILQFNYIGYIAVALTLLSMYMARRVRAVEEKK
ncbi:MAG: MFS transporter [Aureispira sp.]|nr:MFS transporter [Aureispira sp.]